MPIYARRRRGVGPLPHRTITAHDPLPGTPPIRERAACPPLEAVHPHVASRPTLHLSSLLGNLPSTAGGIHLRREGGRRPVRTGSARTVSVGRRRRGTS